MKYLLDTDICIYTIKKSPNKVFNRLSACKVGDVGISAITYSELSCGVSYSRNPDHNRIALHEFLAPLEILDYQAEAAPVYGALRAELRKSGKMFGPLGYAHCRTSFAHELRIGHQQHQRIQTS